jgi:competence protein ComEC
MSLAPMILLEKIHLWMIDIFAGAFAPFFTLYKAHIGWALAMAFFLFLCTRLRLMWLALVLLAVPYIPSDVEMGGYFPNLGRSKGFVVVDDRVHVFYKGHHGDFVYGFLPYLAEIGVKRADTGTIDIYGGENIFIPVGEVSEDYGWVCVNSLDESCKAVYHTRSNTYGCDEDRVHILYKNRCADENTYLLYETGDLKIDNPSE